MPGPFLGSVTPANEGWFARQIDSLQRQINELRSARTLESATIGRGGLAITDSTQAASTAAANQAQTDIQAGSKGGSIIVADSGGVIWDSYRDLAIERAWNDSAGNLNFTSTWTKYFGTITMSVPYGMSYVSLIVNSNAGESLSGGSGNLSVASIFRQLDASNNILYDGVGAVVNSGNNTVPVGYSYNSAQGYLQAGCTKIQIGVYVIDSIGSATRVANSGNWGSSCFAVFSRGQS